MSIRGVFDRIESNYGEEQMENLPLFFLVEFSIVDGRAVISEVLPIETKDGLEDIDITENLMLLTDKYGNVLFDNINDSDFYRICILFASEDKIIIGKKKLSSDNFKDITLYKYSDGKLDKKECLFDSDKEILTNFMLPSREYDNLLIQKIVDDKDIAYIYSVKDCKHLSPTFKSLEVCEDTSGKLLKYTDTVESNDTIDNHKLTSEIAGFITIDGVLKNEVYDDRTKNIKVVNLDTHPNFMQYRAFKNFLSKSLDFDIENENEKRMKKRVNY